MKTLCLTLGILLVAFVCISSATNHTDDGSGSGGSGSASGSGSGDLSCADCSHGCNYTSMGPMCYCPIGYILGDDDATCQVCPGGYWGMGCSMMCDCGNGGNPCNNTVGTCICNSCYSGTRCETDVGSGCLLEFLQEPDKTASTLAQRYGGQVYPLPPSNTITGLIVELMGVNTAALIANPELSVMSRDAVGQGPLVKLTWTVDYTVDRPQAEAGLLLIQEKVKLGDVRVTLIEQALTNTAEVTVNAGIKN